MSVKYKLSKIDKYKKIIICISQAEYYNRYPKQIKGIKKIICAKKKWKTI